MHLYGILQFQRGAADDAEALLRQSIAIAPGTRVLSDLGAIAGERGRIGEALEHFAAALRTTPDDVQTLVRRGNTLLGCAAMTTRWRRSTARSRCRRWCSMRCAIAAARCVRCVASTKRSIPTIAR